MDDTKPRFLPDWISINNSKTSGDSSVFVPEWISGLSAGQIPAAESTARPLIIKGGNCVIPGKGIYPTDVYINEGKIAAMGTGFDETGCEIIEVTGKYILPGAIDPHNHLGIFAPFETEVFSETRSAAVNGVTTLGVYLSGQNSYLPALDGLIKTAKEKSVADIFLHLPIFSKEQLEEIPVYYSRYGIKSFKAYMCGIPGMIPSLDEGFLLDVMSAVAAAGPDTILNVHAENYHIVDWATGKMKTANPASIDLTQWKQTHPGFSEAEAIHRAVYLAEQTGVTLYFVHVSSKESIDLIRELRQKNKNFYVETTSPYLTMTDKTASGPLAKMTPPIGTEEDRAALWQGIREGLIDSVGTDHTPLTREQKLVDRPLWDTLPGYPAVGTHVPFLLDGARREGVTLEEITKLMSFNPAKIFGIYPRKGTIMPGSDADLIIANPYQEGRVSPEQAASRSDFALRQGENLMGWPVLVIKGGRPITMDRIEKGQYGPSNYLKR